MSVDRQIIDKIDLKHPIGCAICSDLYEVPGYPSVVFQVRKYNGSDGVKQARQDVPYLFKAFETGYPSPAVLRRQKHKDQNRNFYTIHEYLDWTVSARVADDEVEVDFDGFRVVLLFHRYVRQFPSPDDLEDPASSQKAVPQLSAPLAPLPQLMWDGKAISVATVRTGRGHMEMPFMATHESKRGRGFGKVMVQVIEQMCRYLTIPRILLCSTNDQAIVGFWQHVGFKHTNAEALKRLEIDFHALVHMQETVQMVKDTPPEPVYQAIVIKHQNFSRRVYRVVKRKREGGNPGGGGQKAVVQQRQHGQPQQAQQFSGVNGKGPGRESKKVAVMGGQGGKGMGLGQSDGEAAARVKGKQSAAGAHAADSKAGSKVATSVTFDMTGSYDAYDSVAVLQPLCVGR